MGTAQGGHQHSLCWGCVNTNRHKCSWFDPDDPQPVPGWVAEPRTSDGYYGTPSYLVKECPKFEPVPGYKPPAPQGTRRGITRKKRRWVARINHRRKNYYLGSFKTEEEALAARRAAEEAIKRGEEPCAVNRRLTE